ncbi:MAG: magnesium transporter [Chlamydiales bacterium]
MSHRELESPISKFISPAELCLSLNQTVEEVIQILQSKKIKREYDYFYVVDGENVLQGMITLGDILYNPPNTPLTDILDTDIVKAYEDDPLEKGLKKLTTHQLLIIPIVDRENHFVGLLEVSLSEADASYRLKKIQYKNQKEDIFQFIGFSIEQRKRDSPWIEFRYRMPWLLCNLVGGLICAVISDFFQTTLSSFVILAVFIPLVLALSESVAIQSMTLSLRFLHIRKIHWNQVWRRLFIEGKTSLLLGLASAFIITFFYFAWSVELTPVIAIGISIILAMVVSALFGAGFPITLHVLRLDPKVAAGPVVLMMADVITISVYLGLSTFLLVKAPG